MPAFLILFFRFLCDDYSTLMAVWSTLKDIDTESIA
jgi:hypothetical protein